jgi:hypothetical protein
MIGYGEAYAGTELSTEQLLKLYQVRQQTFLSGARLTVAHA